MNKSIWILIAVSMLFSTGCAVTVTRLPDLDTSKPVEIREDWVGISLVQNGKTINLHEALSKFADIPEAQSDLSTRNVYFWSGVLPVLVGGGFVGWAIGDSNGTNRGQTAAIGVGLIGVGFGLRYFSDVYLRKVLGIYNKKFGVKSAAQNEFYPLMAPVAGGGVAGLGISF